MERHLVAFCHAEKTYNVPKKRPMRFVRFGGTVTPQPVVDVHPAGPDAAYDTIGCDARDVQKYAEENLVSDASGDEGAHPKVVQGKQSVLMTLVRLHRVPTHYFLVEHFS